MNARRRYPSDDRPRIPSEEARLRRNERQRRKYREAHPGARTPTVGATSCNEYDYSTDEFEFLKAMMDYQSRTGKRFPTLTEIFHVLLSLGYRKP